MYGLNIKTVLIIALIIVVLTMVFKKLSKTTEKIIEATVATNETVKEQSRKEFMASAAYMDLSTRSLPSFMQQSKTGNLSIQRSGSKGESETKDIIESLTGEMFDKVRPDWLKNPYTGQNLELDLYNKKLKLAIEVNGRQHTNYTPHFHGNKVENFQKQVVRDKIKEFLCNERGIKLISISDSMPNKREYLKNELKLINS